MKRHDDGPIKPPRPVRDGVALAAAVGVVGVVFGVLARSAGLSVAQACAMSLLVFTGASQFAAVGIVGAGGSGAAAIGSALLLAARNTLYGPVVERWFRRDRVVVRAALAQVVIDESTGVGAAQSTDADRRRGFIATGIGVYVLWNLGTLVGAVAGEGKVASHYEWATLPQISQPVFLPRRAEGNPGAGAVFVGLIVSQRPDAH